MLGRLRGDAAEFLGLELGHHALADLIALADLLRVLQADLGVGVFHFLHDVAQQAGAEGTDLGIDIDHHVVILDLVVFLHRDDNRGLDLLDQVVFRQAALFFQRRQCFKEFVVRSSHFYGFLPI